MGYKKDVIKNFRKSKNKALLTDFRFKHNGIKVYGEAFDLNYVKRKKLILTLYKQYLPEDKALIRWFIKQEIKNAIKTDHNAETLDLCAFMLYDIMSLNDIYLLYEAKFGNTYDNSFFLDIELIFGFDRKETKTYLKKKQSKKKQNKEIFKMIKWYENNCKDDPDAFKPRKKYIEYYRNNKGPKLIKALKKQNE